MIFGSDFFKIFNLIIQIMRLFGRVFGDADDKKAVDESVKRSANPNADEAV